jgi:hypothetical protein
VRRSRPGGEGRPERPALPCLRKRCKGKRKALGLCAKHYHLERRARHASVARPRAVQIFPSAVDKWLRPGQDRACNRCGAPTVWGYCLICTPSMVEV